MENKKVIDDLRDLNSYFELIFRNIQNEIYTADKAVVQHILDAQKDLHKAMLKVLEKK